MPTKRCEYLIAQLPCIQYLRQIRIKVFLLYTRLASIHPVDGESKEPFRGLGYLDGKSDTLTVRLELRPPTIEPPTLITSNPPVKKSGRNKGRSAHGKGKKDKVNETKVIEVELAQDRTALRSRSGDTGSVLWRARSVSSLSTYILCDGLSDLMGLLVSISHVLSFSSIISQFQTGFSTPQTWIKRIS